MALQLRRGTNQQRLSMTPANGELIFVTDYQLVTTSVTSINTSTETLSTTAAHGLSVNQQVKYIGDTLNGLTANQVYYVKTAPTITDFTLSTSLGGGTLNISGSFTVPLVFAKTPTTAAGAPVGTGVSALWVGDGVTVGGLIAANLNLDDLLDVEITSVAEGNTLYYDATTGFWRNTNIITVDDVNSRVGINNPTPTQPLDVSGNGQFSGAIYGNNTDQATTAYTGSIQTLGGIGVVKNAFIGGAIYGNNTDNATTAFTGGIQSLGGIGVAKAVYAGGKITTADSTQSTTPSTGALIVGGGAGIGANLSVGGAIYGNSTDQATSASTGAIQTLGGIGVTKDIFVGGSALVNNTNNATTAYTGSIQTLGGIGVVKNAFIGGAIYGNDTDNATTAYTGGIQSLGGIGLVKDIFVGGAGTITTDLAVNGGDITTTAATASVFNTTATNVSIANAGTTITIGANGSGDTTVRNDLTVNTGTVKTNSGNVFLFDTTATTVDAFGAATSINIGAATGTTTINNSAIITGDLTVNGTTTTINTQTLLVEDKNIEIGVVATPTDVTAAGGGITLLGATNKTITWNNATDGWEFNQSIKVTGNAVLSGDLTVGGNDIKSSTDTAMTLSGNDVTVLGDLDVNAGTIGTIATTGNLFNTAATTVNIAGAGTTVAIGAATGTTTIGNDLAVNGTYLTLDANNAGAGNDIYIVANRGSSGTDATAAWLESTGFWTFSNKLYGIDEVVGGNSIGTNGNNIYFNNENGATLADCFITVKRPSDPDPAIKWNESTDRWQTTVDASTYINIPNQALDTTSDATFNSVTIDTGASIDTQSTTTTAITATAISTTTGTAQKVIITIKDNVSNETHILEALAFKDLVQSIAILTTYAEMYTSAALATFTADISGGSLRILATPASTNSTTFKVVRIDLY